MADLIDEARFKDLARSKCDSGAKRLAIGVENELKWDKSGEGVGPGGEEERSGAAGEEGNFEGSNEFLVVVGMNPGGGGRIEAEEEAVEASRAACFHGEQALTESGIALGAGAEAIKGSAEIETGSTGEDGETAA